MLFAWGCCRLFVIILLWWMKIHYRKNLFPQHGPVLVIQIPFLRLLAWTLMPIITREAIGLPLLILEREVLCSLVMLIVLKVKRFSWVYGMSADLIMVYRCFLLALPSICAPYLSLYYADMFFLIVICNFLVVTLACWYSVFTFSFILRVSQPVMGGRCSWTLETSLLIIGKDWVPHLLIES